MARATGARRCFNSWPIEPDTSIGGIVAAVRPLKTKKGDRMAVFTLEDSGGSVEIVVFPDAFGRCGQLIEVGALVLVRGKLERDDETTRILASEIAPIESVRERLAKSFRYVICQRLIPKADRSGRIPAVEILKANARTRECIEKGEREDKTLLAAMKAGESEGMQHFDSEIAKLVRNYVCQSGAEEARFGMCRDHLWVRILGRQEMDLLFRMQNH